MGTKNHPGEFDCYEAAAPDEPMFILLASDEQAPDRVEAWARKRATQMAERMLVESTKRSGIIMVDDGGTDQTWLMRELRKIAEALQCAKNMREWRINKKVKDKLASTPVTYPWGDRLPVKFGVDFGLEHR